MRALKDRYGFFFWLSWILWFAGSFILAAMAWTWGLTKLFGPIRYGELTLTWAVAVFGTWFLLVVPFMRKKEQIWKRLNEDQEKAVDVWLGGMSLFIGSLIFSCLFWGLRFKARIITPDNSLDEAWMKSVFGTWLALLFPFLFLMYKQAETLFKTAEERQTRAPSFRSAWMDETDRQLSEDVRKKVQRLKSAMPDGHVVTAVLADGRRVPHVFIFKGREILGVYDREQMDFVGAAIVDVEEIPLEALPAYEEEKWLRMDIKKLK